MAAGLQPEDTYQNFTQHGPIQFKSGNSTSEGISMSGENFIVGVILAGKAITQLGTHIEIPIKNF